MGLTVPQVTWSSTTENGVEIREAEKQVQLLVWAAKSVAAKGMPQAAAMQAKADAAMATLEALKAGNSAPMSSAPVSAASTPSNYVAPAVLVPTTTSASSRTDIEDAEKYAKSLAWAAKNVAAKGYPLAAKIQA